MEDRKIEFTNPEPLAKTHYVCIGGCGLVSNVPMKCTSLGCPRNRNPLAKCDCKDGKHSQVPMLDAAGFSTKKQSEINTSQTN